VTTKAGEEQVVEVELSPSKSPVTAAALPSEQVSSAVTLPPDEPQSDEKSVVPLIIGGGVTALALASGIGFRIAASSRQNDADRLAHAADWECSGAGKASCRELRDAHDAVDRNKNLSTASFIVAGAAAVGTLAYWLWPHASAQTGVRAGAAIASQGGAISLTGSF
jgi:hypothetical protein